VSFERSVNDSLHRLNEPANGDGAESNLRAALSLYSGHFLARESEESWMLTPRLRLKTKFERLVATLSMHLENHERFADAIDLCLHALEFDPLNELLYRRLMSCYLKEGEVAGVVRTYLRCREALAKGLAATPSIETERLYLEGMRAINELNGAQAAGQSYLLGLRFRNRNETSLGLNCGLGRETVHLRGSIGCRSARVAVKIRGPGQKRPARPYFSRYT
jgi:DNA-binding SARP family transcriptional activator